MMPAAPTDAADETTGPAPGPEGGRPRPRRAALIAGAFALLALIALAAWLWRGPLAERFEPAPPEAPAVDETAALRARIVELETNLAQARQAAAASESRSQGSFDAAIEARVAALEASQTRVNRAAAAAVAASMVAHAAERGAPFTRELAALERADPSGALAAGLREPALTGVPSRAAIGAAFHEAALGAAAVARAEGRAPGAVDRFLSGLGRIFTLRRVEGLEGASPDAVLARAERRAAAGDLEGALLELDALSATGQAALADWTATARRRIELDRRVAGLRARALEGLAGDPPPLGRGPTP